MARWTKTHVPITGLCAQTVPVGWNTAQTQNSTRSYNTVQNCTHHHIHPNKNTHIHIQTETRTHKRTSTFTDNTLTRTLQLIFAPKPPLTTVLLETARSTLPSSLTLPHTISLKFSFPYAIVAIDEVVFDSEAASSSYQNVEEQLHLYAHSYLHADSHFTPHFHSCLSSYACMDPSSLP